MMVKWKERTAVKDLPTGPKNPRSTVRSIEEESGIVDFHRHTLLPLDDCLYALHATILHLTHTWLHRSLQRDSISRLPEITDDKTPKRKFKTYPIGYFHLDIAKCRPPKTSYLCSSPSTGPASSLSSNWIRKVAR